MEASMSDVVAILALFVAAYAIASIITMIKEGF